MKLPSSDEERDTELSAKARCGTLTDSETQELDSYLHIGILLGVMQSGPGAFSNPSLISLDSEPGTCSKRSRGCRKAV